MVTFPIFRPDCSSADDKNKMDENQSAPPVTASVFVFVLVSSVQFVLGLKVLGKSSFKTEMSAYVQFQLRVIISKVAWCSLDLGHGALTLKAAALSRRRLYGVAFFMHDLRSYRWGENCYARPEA